MPPAGLPRANIDRGGGRPRAPGPALCSELTVKSCPGHTGLGQRCPGGSVPAHARVRPHGERHRGLGKPLHPAPHPAVVSLLVSGIIPAPGQGAGQDAQGVMEEKEKEKDRLFPQPPAAPHSTDPPWSAWGAPAASSPPSTNPNLAPGPLRALSKHQQRAQSPPEQLRGL